jgi:hypothetical protein
MKDWTATWGSEIAIGHNSDGSWGFSMPTTDGVHYISRPYGGALIKSFEFHYTFAPTDQQYKFVTADGGAPFVTLYFSNGSFETGSSATDNDGRWWAMAARMPLKNGTLAAMASATPQKWGNVDGKNGATRIAQFNQCLQSCKYVGFTFGGSFPGHGLWCPQGGVFSFIHRVVV